MTTLFPFRPSPAAWLIATLLFSPVITKAQVRLGIDELERSDFKLLESRRVALITNQTGVNSQGESTVDVLFRAKNMTLVSIMSPEHGFRGTAEHGQEVLDSSDSATGLPVYSLYGKNTRPTDEMLKGADTIVFDIQDIGTRFYTYITTMGQALEEAKKRNMWFIVLDRPNPLRGDIVEGDVLDADIKRMTGYFQIPTRHGFTVGELAKWVNRTSGIRAYVKVSPLRRWKRNEWFDQTEAPFIPPSPNIRNLTAALLYPGVGSFEATNVSVGRGTDTPFEHFGAPWINGKELCTYLRAQNLSGVLFETAIFTPENDIYKGERCEGVRMIVTNRNTLRPVQIFLASFLFLHQKYPVNFKPEWEEVRVVTGSNKLKDTAEGRMTLDELNAAYLKSQEAFIESVRSFYLY